MPPSISWIDYSRRDDKLFRLAFRDAPRLLAADRSDLSLQVANARFARVVPDQ